MRSSSRKAKGRRACQEAQDAILSVFPSLSPDDVRIASSGANGEDILLSTAAMSEFPFAVEVKNQERISIWKALEQAETHGEKKLATPLLIFKRNRGKLYAALPLDALLELVRPTSPSRGNQQHEPKPTKESRTVS